MIVSKADYADWTLDVSTAMEKLCSMYAEDEMIVLVHPTQESLALEQIANRDMYFHALVTALSSRIDISEMFHFALEGAGVSENVIEQLQLKMCDSGLLGKLQLFVRQIITMIETFGWFTWQVNEEGVPEVFRDYMLAYVPKQKKWHSLAGADELQLSFVNYPDRALNPLSTASAMQPFFERMHKLRLLHLEAVKNSSRPTYITGSVKQEEDSEKPAATESKLDKRVANQANTNQMLEEMVNHHISSSSSSSRQRNCMFNSLDGFVAGMSKDNVKISHQVSKLEAELQSKNRLLKDLLGAEHVPLLSAASTQIPMDQMLLASHLNVHAINLVDHEKDYERKWMSVGIGALTNHNTRQQETQQDYSCYLEQKSKFYKSLIVHEILNQTGLLLLVKK